MQTDASDGEAPRPGFRGIRSSFTEQELPGGVLICLVGDLDLASVGDLRASLQGVVRARTGLIVVDVAQGFVDLTGVQALVEVSGLAERLGRTLVIAGLPALWDRALPRVGLDDRLRRRPDVVAALRDFGAG